MQIKNNYCKIKIRFFNIVANEFYKPYLNYDIIQISSFKKH